MLKGKAKKHLLKLRNILNDSGYIVESIYEKAYNYECAISSGENKFKLLVYFGKKGIKTVLQGNRNLPEFSRVNELVLGEIDMFVKETIKEEPDAYIGTDETGKGDIFGPLVVAGVFVNEKTKVRLRKLGVKDSKELTDSTIWEMAKKIAAVEGLQFKVISVEPESYNQLYDKYKNINKLLDKLHSDVVEDLLAKVNCGVVITDKFHVKDIDIQAAANNKNVKFIAVNKAEKFIGVAAASILARAKMLQWFQRNSTEAGMLPLGSSTDAEKFILASKKELDNLQLNKYAKMHFKTWKKLS